MTVGCISDKRGSLPVSINCLHPEMRHDFGDHRDHLLSGNQRHKIRDLAATLCKTTSGSRERRPAKCPWQRTTTQTKKNGRCKVIQKSVEHKTM